MKKKFLSLAMAAVMTAAMSISALAAEVKIDADAIFGTDGANMIGDLNDKTVQRNDDKYGQEGQVGLKPTNKADKDTTGYNVTFNAEKAGKYTIRIAYISANDTNRGFSYQIDGGERTDVFVGPTSDSKDDWKASKPGIEEIKDVELTAGNHTVKLACPSDYDTHKAVNVVYLSYELTEEAQGQAPADGNNGNDQAEEPTTAAPADEKPAQTGDNAAPMVFVALAAVAVAGVAVVCRKKTA